jgi:hypothetical protein
LDNFIELKIMRFQCDGHRPIEAEGLKDAGEQFARIKANRLGRNGTVGTCRMDSWSSDGNSATFQAFIGTYDRKTRMTVGNNEWFLIRKI